MAVLAVTAANVSPSAAAVRQGAFRAGVAITAGQALYLDAANLWQLATIATPGTAAPTAIAANSAAAGQLVDAILSDPAFTHGLTGVLAGDTIWGFTGGGMTKTIADIVATNFAVVMGFATSATQMKLAPLASGVSHA